MLVIKYWRSETSFTYSFKLSVGKGNHHRPWVSLYVLISCAKNAKPSQLSTWPFLRVVCSESPCGMTSLSPAQKVGLLSVCYKRGGFPSSTLFLSCNANPVNARHPTAPHAALRDSKASKTLSLVQESVSLATTHKVTAYYLVNWVKSNPNMTLTGSKSLLYLKHNTTSKE